ncbi:hypothetical protein SFRURICE_011666 [Spodoptera frugiperda]|nr:hypothetical protein SFRURICE_011666 [Spodoptera frugiperda]
MEELVEDCHNSFLYFTPVLTASVWCGARGDVVMEVVLPLAVVCVLVSAAHNATRARHPDDLPEEPVLPDDDEELLHKLDYYDEERINISG